MAEKMDHEEQIADQFTKQAEAYSRLTGSMASDRTAALRALLQPCGDDTALDVACGPGSLAMELAPFVRHVTGIDLTPAMLEQAKAAQAEKGIDNVDWLSADAYALPFEDGRYALVVCRAAFHHFDAPNAAFAEMVRVCKPDGRIAVIDVTPEPDKADAYDGVERMRDPSHVHAHTVAELVALGAGLPLSAPQVGTSLAADIPLEAILATSFPAACTVDEIREWFREDALSGENRLGFCARMVDGRICVSYPLSSVVWTKLGTPR